jgi:hypothetical protein
LWSVASFLQTQAAAKPSLGVVDQKNKKIKKIEVRPSKMTCIEVRTSVLDNRPVHFTAFRQWKFWFWKPVDKITLRLDPFGR